MIMQKQHNSSHYDDYEEPMTSIRKLANEMKVYEKTMRTVIKQNLGPYLNTLDYTI